VFGGFLCIKYSPMKIALIIALIIFIHRIHITVYDCITVVPHFNLKILKIYHEFYLLPSLNILD